MLELIPMLSVLALLLLMRIEAMGQLLLLLDLLLQLLLLLLLDLQLLLLLLLEVLLMLFEEFVLLFGSHIGEAGDCECDIGTRSGNISSGLIGGQSRETETFTHCGGGGHGPFSLDSSLFGQLTDIVFVDHAIAGSISDPEFCGKIVASRAENVSQRMPGDVPDGGIVSVRHISDAGIGQIDEPPHECTVVTATYKQVLVEGVPAHTGHLAFVTTEGHHFAHETNIVQFDEMVT